VFKKIKRDQDWEGKKNEKKSPKLRPNQKTEEGAIAIEKSGIQYTGETLRWLEITVEKEVPGRSGGKGGHPQASSKLGGSGGGSFERQVVDVSMKFYRDEGGCGESGIGSV